MATPHAAVVDLIIAERGHRDHRHVAVALELVDLLGEAIPWGIISR